MIFREAKESDFKAIAGLVSSPDELYLVYPAGSYPWTESQIAEIMQVRSSLTVAVDNNVVIGFANLYDVKVGESAFLGNVIISDAHKGAGIGKALVQHMMDLCRRKYSATPHLSVFNTNTRALLLYYALGFQPYDMEERVDIHGQHLAMLHMKTSD